MSLNDEMLAKMKKKSGDPKAMIDEFMKLEYTELGRTQIDGIKAEGIETTDSRLSGGVLGDIVVVSQVWVDVDTQFPVLIEMKTSSNDGKMQMEMVMDGFEWGVELDQAIFKPEIPENYELMPEIRIPDGSGDTIVEGLKNFAELTGGIYPSKMDFMTTRKEMSKIIKEKMSTNPNSPNRKEQMDHFNIIRKNVYKIFMSLTLLKDKELAYYGDVVTADDAYKILMRWKISDDENKLDKYRVIYGDLSTEDISAEQLKEFETAMTK